MLTFKEAQEANVARCQDPAGFNHLLHSWSIAEWTNAMCGEAGEAANIAKKLIRFRDGVRGNTETQAQLAEKLGRELGDTVIYAMLTAARLGIDLGEVVQDAYNRKSAEIGYPGRI
jgi:NTP pyrophosphatase (non-canonical NTP hydrolase)